MVQFGCRGLCVMCKPGFCILAALSPWRWRLECSVRRRTWTSPTHDASNNRMSKWHTVQLWFLLRVADQVSHSHQTTTDDNRDWNSCWCLMSMQTRQRFFVSSTWFIQETVTESVLPREIGRSGWGTPLSADSPPTQSLSLLTTVGMSCDVLSARGLQVSLQIHPSNH
jgi:hypothetical protein